VELHSMSKGFNMTGWRLGFVVGNPLIVKAYADVKDNTDSGQFLAIQEACARFAGSPGDHREDFGKVFAADGRFGRRVEQAWAAGEEAQGFVFPVREGASRRRAGMASA